MTTPNDPTDRTQPVAPRPAATVMLLRDALDGGQSSIEVLLLQRSSNTPFVPGAHVFPGGALEPGDAHDHPAVLGLLDPADADQILEVGAGGRAYWVAAVRECLEEAGVLLAVDGDGAHLDAGHPAFEDVTEARGAIERGERSLVDFYDTHGLRIPMHDIAYVSRWITPELSPRRYDTRFFAAAMPAHQRSRADGWEAVDSVWARPTDALADWQAGSIDLIAPTVASLRLLTRFESTRAALDNLHAGALRQPRIREPEGGDRVPIAGDLVAGRPADTDLRGRS